MPPEEQEKPRKARDAIAALDDAVTDRRGFVVFLTLVVIGFCLLRILFPNAPSNADVNEQLWMSVDWRWGYGSGVNPPLFTWLVKLVDAILGATRVSVEVVRFTLLWLFCFLSAYTIRAITGDVRLSALAGLAPFTVYAVGWEALFRHSNTMLLMVSFPMTLVALLRLDRRDDWGGYLIFALTTVFGFYSKYNYALVWLAFLGAALMDDRLRSRVLNRRMIVAMLLVLLLVSPLIYWVATHTDAMLGHGRLRLTARPTYPSLPGQLSAAADLLAHTAGMALPLIAFLVLLCPRAFGRLGHAGAVAADQARWDRLLGRYLLVVAIVLVTAIFTLGMARFQARYVYVLLPALPFFFLRLAAADFDVRGRRWLTAIMVGVILLVMAGTAYRSLTYSQRTKHAAATPFGASVSAAAPRLVAAGQWGGVAEDPQPFDARRNGKRAGEAGKMVD